MSDLIVEQTRKVREAYAAQFGFDISFIVKDLRGWAATHPHEPHRALKASDTRNMAEVDTARQSVRR